MYWCVDGSLPQAGSSTSSGGDWIPEVPLCDLEAVWLTLTSKPCAEAEARDTATIARALERLCHHRDPHGRGHGGAAAGTLATTSPWKSGSAERAAGGDARTAGLLRALGTRLRGRGTPAAAAARLMNRAKLEAIVASDARTAAAFRMCGGASGGAGGVAVHRGGVHRGGVHGGVGGALRMTATAQLLASLCLAVAAAALATPHGATGNDAGSGGASSIGSCGGGSCLGDDDFDDGDDELASAVAGASPADFCAVGKAIAYLIVAASAEQRTLMAPETTANVPVQPLVPDVCDGGGNGCGEDSSSDSGNESGGDARRGGMGGSGTGGRCSGRAEVDCPRRLLVGRLDVATAAAGLTVGSTAGGSSAEDAASTGAGCEARAECGARVGALRLDVAVERDRCVICKCMSLKEFT